MNADGTPGRAQRRALRLHRTQARHPRESHLRDDVRRERRRARPTGGRGRIAASNTCSSMMNAARLSVGLEGYAHGRARLPAGRGVGPHARAGQAAGAAAKSVASMGTSSSPAPIIGHPDVKRMLLDMKSHGRSLPRAGAVRGRASSTSAHAHPDEARARGAGARRSAHSHRQGLVHRDRHRDRRHRHPGARRHGLHRGNRRGAVPCATCASRRSTRARPASSRTISSAASSAATAARRCRRFSRTCSSRSRRTRRSCPGGPGPRRGALDAVGRLRAADRALLGHSGDARRIAPWRSRCRS